MTTTTGTWYPPTFGTGGFLADAAPLLSNPPFMYSMTPPDFRALCAELVAWAEKTSAHYYAPPDVLTRARAALAEPEPEGPSEDDLTQLLFDSFREPIEFICDSEEEARLMIRSHVKFALAALARWGQRHPQPVPVSERPWEREGWCDGQGRCWLLLHSDDGFHVPGWRLDKPSHYDLPDRAVSLPAHALPVPGEVEG